MRTNHNQWWWFPCNVCGVCKEHSVRKSQSRHDTERDRIIGEWSELGSFTCSACRQEIRFPESSQITREVRYGQFRFDVGVRDDNGCLLGAVEVVASHPPSDAKLAYQSSLGFVYYRLLAYRGVEAAWLCSPDCWAWYSQLPDHVISCQWDAPRCTDCEGYFHDNLISRHQFMDWNDPGYPVCISCAAKVEGAQWAAPGSMIRGMEKDPELESDLVASTFRSFCTADFWAEVWRVRVARMRTPDARPELAHPDGEVRTRHRMQVVFNAMSLGHWNSAAVLLRGVGAPGWEQEYNQKFYAWDPINCIFVAAAWQVFATHWYGLLPREIRQNIAHRPLAVRCPVCTGKTDAYSGACYSRCLADGERKVKADYSDFSQYERCAYGCNYVCHLGGQQRSL